MASYLLHGVLDVTIYEAENLVNEQRSTGSAPVFLRKVQNLRVSRPSLCSGTLFFGLPDSCVQETYKISRSSAELHCSNAPVLARKHIKWGSNFDVRALLY